VITGIQAIDGLFFAVNRRVVERVRFDEQFQGFHYYDLDFSLSCYQAGFQLAVVNDVHAIHLSSGSFGPEWQRLAPRFLAKWQLRLTPRPERPLSFCGVTVRTKEEVLEIINPSYLD
jgi:GT2 family glycosyltransferase